MIRGLSRCRHNDIHTRHAPHHCVTAQDAGHGLGTAAAAAVPREARHDDDEPRAARGEARRPGDLPQHHPAVGHLQGEPGDGESRGRVAIRASNKCSRKFYAKFY